MRYKTIVLKYCPNSEKMASMIEECSNKMLKDGYELVCFSETTTAHTILVFKENKIIR